MGYSPWGRKESDMTGPLTFSHIKLVKMRDSLVIHTSTAGGAGLIPAWRTKILPAGLETKVPHTSKYSQEVYLKKKRKKKVYDAKFCYMCFIQERREKVDV